MIRTALPKQYATLLSSTNVSRVPGYARARLGDRLIPDIPSLRWVTCAL